MSLVQPNSFIINSENLSHGIISGYSYVKESILGDTSMIRPISENREISINYASMHEMLEKNFIIFDDVFVYSVAQEIIKYDDIEPCSGEECQHKAD